MSVVRLTIGYTSLGLAIASIFAAVILGSV